MYYTHRKLTELQKELKEVVRQVAQGKLTQGTAAEKIVNLREEMNKVIDHLRKSEKI